MKHVNGNYLFPVVTSQERDLILNDIVSISAENGSISARYDEKPQSDLVGKRPDAERFSLDTGERQPQLRLQARTSSR